MAEERTGSDSSMGQRLKRSVETHVLVPLAVTIVSAATHYLIKKLPLILEEKVLPKLREQADAEGVRAAVAETATAVGEKVAGVVPDVEASDGGDGGEESAATARPKRRQTSADEREQERQRREERRGERKRAVQKA